MRNVLHSITLVFLLMIAVCTTAQTMTLTQFQLMKLNAQDDGVVISVELVRVTDYYNVTVTIEGVADVADSKSYGFSSDVSSEPLSITKLDADGYGYTNKTIIRKK